MCLERSERNGYNDENKFDLARLLINIYGSDYIEHSRLEKLVERNCITNTDFLAGKEEASAFDNKEYIKLHQSTLRKVDVILEFDSNALKFVTVKL